MSRGQFPGVMSWIRLSVRHGFASGRSLCVTAFVGTSVLAALSMPVILAVAGTNAQTSGSSSPLNTITVDPDAAEGQPPLTTSIRSKIKAIPGVESVTALTTGTFYAGDGKNNWIAVANVMRPSLIPPGIDRTVALSLTDDEVIAPRVVDGVDISAYVGKLMPIEYTAGTGKSQGTMAPAEVKLVAVYDPEWTGYGPDAALATERFVTRLVAERYRLDPAEFLEREGVPGVVVQVDTADRVPSVKRDLQAMGFAPIRDSDRTGSLPGLVAFFPVLITLTSGALGLLVVAQTVAAARNATSRRTREFALLRMRGYTTRDVRQVIVLDISSGALVGALVGVSIGMPIGGFLAGWVIPADVHQSLNGDITVQLVATAISIVVAMTAVAAIAVGLATARVHRADPFLLATREN